MAFRLARNAPVSADLRRIVREEIAYATRQLRKADADDRDEAIHEARKCVKKLRGVVRMLEPVLGQVAVRDNATLRDTGRNLAGHRDAAALVETVDMLLRRFPEDPVTSPIESIRQMLARRRDEFAEADNPRPAAIRALSGLRRLVNLWPIPEGDFNVVGPGLERTYRRGRRNLRKAIKDPSAENLHDLRKRVKDHWYHVRLVKELWPAVLEPRELELKQLQEQLGDDHNLTMLEEALAAAPADFGDETELALFRPAIDTLRGELRAQAFETAERLYEQKSGRFVKRLRNVWEVWRTRPTVQRRQPITAGARRRSQVA